MGEEKTDGSASKSGGVSGCLLTLLLPAGGILFAFGAVGLYEDRELLSLDSALVAAGLVLMALSIPVILRALDASEESSGYGIGGGVLLTIMGSIKLARAIANNSPWWGIGICLVVVIVGIYWIVQGLGEKREKAAAEQSSVADEPAATDEQGDDPPGT